MNACLKPRSEHVSVQFQNMFMKLVHHVCRTLSEQFQNAVQQNRL